MAKISGEEPDEGPSWRAKTEVGRYRFDRTIALAGWSQFLFRPRGLLGAVGVSCVMVLVVDSNMTLQWTLGICPQWVVGR